MHGKPAPAGTGELPARTSRSIGHRFTLTGPVAGPHMLVKKSLARGMWPACSRVGVDIRHRAIARPYEQ